MGKAHTGKRNLDTVTTTARKNVRSAAEQLKELNSFDDFVKLKSIKEILSALDIPPEAKSTSRGESESSNPLNLASDSDNTANDNYTTHNDTGEGNSDKSSAGNKMAKSSGDSKPLDRDNDTSLISKVSRSYKRISCLLHPRKMSTSNLFGVFFSILAFIFYFELHTAPGFTRMWLKWENVELRSVECTIESPNFAMELFRPPVPCDVCRDVRSVDRVDGISPTDFERLYAYSGRPVIVSDAMQNWSAVASFGFEFFKGIYEEGSRSLEHLGDDCLFFPYATEFRSLAEVFNMSEERHQRPWYIGWSNCDAETSHILRLHYKRPYFLPETAESTHADWIFMGTPGHGAHMHIDHVINPSWQAQIKGRKRWSLQPPPECFYECQSLETDVQSGDIIVLDTNKWYHQTQILPGDMSITIGSEYD